MSYDATCPFCEKKVSAAPGAMHLCHDIQSTRSLKARKALLLIATAITTIVGLMIVAWLAQSFAPAKMSISLSMLGGIIVGATAFVVAHLITTE